MKSIFCIHCWHKEKLLTAENNISSVLNWACIRFVFLNEKSHNKNDTKIHAEHKKQEQILVCIIYLWFFYLEG